MAKQRSQKTVSAAAGHQTALVVAGFLCALLAWALTAREAGESPRFPFVWFDVASVYLLAALPAGWLLAAWIGQQLGHRTAVVASAVVVAALLVLATQDQLQPAALRDLPLPAAAALRAGLAMLAAACVAAIANAIMALWNPGSAAVLPAPESTWRKVLLLLGSGLLAALVPAAYTQTRIGYFEGKLAEYLGQTRLGKANRLAADLSVLDPHIRLGGEPIRTVSAQLQLQVRAIEQQVAQPLPAASSAQSLLERGHQYAVLGRVDDAVRTLRPLVQSGPPHPTACLHLGAAYESREDWSASLHWYQQAQASLLRMKPLPPAVLPMLLQATKGIAFAERRLGRYRESEAAYLQALEWNPSAEMHFLLAQFYEDGQQTALAHEHALAAARLDSAQFATPASELINKLAGHHFGCFSVFTRQKSATSSGVP